MLFHVTIEVHDAIVLDADKRLREVLGPQMQHLMESGKVQASGIFGGRRGGFFLVDVDQVEELYELFGPEVYGNFAMEVQPVMPVEKLGELFQKWATEGR